VTDVVRAADATAARGRAAPEAGRPAPGPLLADPRGRLSSIDVVRGIVMVLMVLDHTRDFFTNARFDPTDLAQTTPALFLTRWITHYCAPAFVFLAGTAAFLTGSRGRTRPDLARFLVTRGLWLIVLEVTLVRWGATFHLPFDFLGLQVIWAIGVSMIALAGLIFLPRSAIAAFAIVTIAGHNLLDGVEARDLGALGFLWPVLHQQAYDERWGTAIVIVYPLIPWVGVMAGGYALGPLFRRGRAGRRRLLLALGLAVTAGFVALRAVNVYGDPGPWTPQPDAVFTVLSFLDTEKYPPSLLYLMMTLGPTFVALALLDREPGRFTRPILVFGRVPLLFYLLQWPLVHGLALGLAAIRDEPLDWLFAPVPFDPPAGYGYELPVVYLVWALAVFILYWPCRWFADLKRRRKDAWLSYL
jgi:uncharacterized membrane protein